MKFVTTKTIAICGIIASGTDAFAPVSNSVQSELQIPSAVTSSSALNFFKGGSGAKDLDEEVSLSTRDSQYSLCEILRRHVLV